MVAYQESHLVACLFWKRHVEGMVDGPGAWMRMMLYRAIYELIKDLHGKSAAGHTAHEVFLILCTPI